MNYETKQITHKNGNVHIYAIINSTAYTYRQCLKDTGKTEVYDTLQLWHVLDRLIKSRERVRIWLGDRDTGKAWNEEYYVKGIIGRSTGDIKIPLMVNNSRSYGGTPLLDHCIVRIDSIAEHRTLWKHPKFYIPDMTLKYEETEAWPYRVYQEGKNICNFLTEDKATKWLQFMRGERYAK